MSRNLTPVYIIGAGLLIAGYFTFFSKNKNWAIKKIIATGNYTSGAEALKTFENEFLIAWGKAADEGDTFFFYKGNKYSVKGGRKAA
jgi:hypothetical protein